MRFYNKLWARITESRWTISYISFAVLQMIIAIVIEAIILLKNENSYGTLTTYMGDDDKENFEKIVYKKYTYTQYSKQFQSIIHGNIWFMVFEAFLTALCFSSLFFQNTIEVISIAIINVCLIFFAGVQIYQSNKWIIRVNSQIELDLKEISLTKDVIPWEALQLVLMIGFTSASIVFGYKLYKQFGWNIYKEIGANIQMQRMYRTYLVFLLLLKLDLLLLMGFQILNLVFLFSDAEEDQTTTIIIQSIMVASVIPIVGLALWGVRRENQVAMFIFAVASVATIVNFIYILAKFIINRDEYLLTLLDILGILITIMSMVIAYLATRNFDRGLKNHFQKRDHEDAVNLEACGGQGQRKRFSIDD
ncbi:hypothetical protein RhiirA4_136239 [Rhizophagus irregularis]|uniref:DUF7789 domain-containing protein n=3 Tax=Rhizophagus irregularis TaxID=588596 RepID=A0A2I1GBV4_9GLOM|nr:hypothetical protein RhiirA4_136239 [Rhizophagus irregularis]